jgi:hypothetical protein
MCQLPPELHVIDTDLAEIYLLYMRYFFITLMVICSPFFSFLAWFMDCGIASSNCRKVRETKSSSSMGESNKNSNILFFPQFHFNSFIQFGSLIYVHSSCFYPKKKLFMLYLSYRIHGNPIISRQDNHLRLTRLFLAFYSLKNEKLGQTRF